MLVAAHDDLSDGKRGDEDAHCRIIRRMGIRALVVLGVLAAVLTWWGGQKTYVAIRDSKQVEITCADYVKKRPDARWLKLTDCEYDFEHLAYEEDSSGSKYRSVYFPLRPSGEKDGPTYIVIKRDDKDMLAIVYALEHGNDHPPGLERVMTDLLKPAEGLVQFGVDLDDKDKDQLAGLGLGLAKDFVIIDNGDKPNLTAGLIMLLLGLGVGGALVWFGIATLRKPKAPPPTYRPPMNPMNPVDPTNPIKAFERPM